MNTAPVTVPPRTLSEEDESRLIKEYMPLVVFMARRYAGGFYQEEDLRATGTIGLLKAIRAFRAERGARFSAYAARCIENELLMYLRRNKRHQRQLYLDAPASREEEATFADLLGTDADVVQRQLEWAEDCRNLRWAVAHLHQRERKLIAMRYGLNGEAPLPQRTIAKMLGVTQSYVSRLEKRALQTLHSMLS